MAYDLQLGKKDTLAAALNAGATTATLTSGNFTNFTSDFLVIDYDVDAKIEVIKCDVTGTSVSSITRAQEGTADIDHSSGAKVAYGFLPSHYEAKATAVDRQNISTDATVSNQRICSGWGYIQGDDSAFVETTKTLPITYDTAPILTVSHIGSDTSTPTDIGDFGSASGVIAVARLITTNSFRIGFSSPDIGSSSNTLDSAKYYGYTWIAIGTKT